LHQKIFMKTKIWLAAIFLLLSMSTSCIAATKEPVPAGTNSLRVVQIGVMSVERAAHQATLLNNGQVLVTGGCARQGCEIYHASTEIFNPATGSFHAASPMSTPRAGHVAILLPDGRVLVAGGWTGQGATASAEIYDPATGVWTAAGDMLDARESLTAVPLPDGPVLITGGSGGLNDPASAEVFDPVTSTFSAVGPMKTNHYLTTPLADGRVLVTGGQNAAGAILRSAEIFDPATNKFYPTGEMSVPRFKHADDQRLPDFILLDEP
jgi:hypothetical protein